MNSNNSNFNGNKNNFKENDAANNFSKVKVIEEALLGLVIVHKKIDGQIAQVFTFLDENHFINKQSKTLYSVLKHFYDLRHKFFDFNLIQKYLEDQKLNQIVTLKYLNHVIENAGYLSSVNEYLNIIRENYAKHKLTFLLKSSLQRVDQEKSLNSIENIRSQLYEIEDRKINKDFQDAKTVVNRVIEDIFTISKEIKGIKTGFISLDEITNGLQKGDLIILAARPSVGKTAFALNLAANAMIMQNHHVAFFSLEMPAEQLIQRLLSMVSFVDNYKLKHNSKLTDRDKDKLLEAQNKIENLHFFIDDSGSIRLDEIIWKSHKQKQLGQLDLIIIDYLQLIPTNSNSDNRQQEVSKISRSLKQLARELNVPIIALSQLNRRVEMREEKKPMMSDLRESGAIEQDADIIAFLFREDYYNKDKTSEKPTVQIVELNIAKHRNGSVGVIELSFNPAIGRFFDNSQNKELEK